MSRPRQYAEGYGYLAMSSTFQALTTNLEVEAGFELLEGFLDPPGNGAARRLDSGAHGKIPELMLHPTWRTMGPTTLSTAGRRPNMAGE
jgi:hypothetical protein